MAQLQVPKDKLTETIAKIKEEHGFNSIVKTKTLPSGEIAILYNEVVKAEQPKVPQQDIPVSSLPKTPTK